MFRRLRASIGQWFRGLRSQKPLGARGEAAAATFLKRRGYKIVARGDRLKAGEIDLVAVDRQTVVFVEVKTRESAETGHPAEAVNAAKQTRLTRAAVAYLKPALQRRKAEIIRNVLAADAEIRNITEPWMQQLQHILGSAARTHRLREAYARSTGPVLRGPS